jgi:hypothetical protein
MPASAGESHPPVTGLTLHFGRFELVIPAEVLNDPGGPIVHRVPETIHLQSGFFWALQILSWHQQNWSLSELMLLPGVFIRRDTTAERLQGLLDTQEGGRRRIRQALEAQHVADRERFRTASVPVGAELAAAGSEALKAGNLKTAYSLLYRGLFWGEFGPGEWPLTETVKSIRSILYGLYVLAERAGDDVLREGLRASHSAWEHSGPQPEESEIESVEIESRSEHAWQLTPNEVPNLRKKPH